VKIEKIKKNYDKFNIPDGKKPIYEDDPNIFIGKYKRCSIKTYGEISYSNTSKISQKKLG
jgi:hypothetical protein